MKLVAKIEITLDLGSSKSFHYTNIVDVDMSAHEILDDMFHEAEMRCKEYYLEANKK
jgi:hypothetical protein